MRLITIGIFSFFLTQISLANNQLDSLISILDRQIHDTIKVQTLEKISWAYHRINPQKTITYAQKSLHLAEEISYVIGVIKAKNILAVGHSINGDISTAITIFEEVIELSEKTNNQFYICGTYNNLGRTFMKIGNFEKAVMYYQRGAKCSETYGLVEQMSDNLLNMATVMQDQGVWDAGNIYAYEALRIASSIQDKELLCDAHKVIGRGFSHQKKFEKALTHLDTAFILANISNDRVGVSSILNQMGEIFQQKGLFTKAFDSHRQAYRVSSQINYEEQMILALKNLAKLYLDNNENNKSIEKSQEGLRLSEQLGDLKNVTKFYDLLSKSYAKQNEFAQAYLSQTKLKSISDSLTIKEKNQKLHELRIQFQLEQKESENQLLKAQQAKNQMKIQQANIKSTAFIITLIGVCIITFLLYRAFMSKHSQSRKLKTEVLKRTRELEKINRDLIKSNKEKERFNHIASHDLKEPLRNIISFTKLLEMRLKSQEDPVAKEYLSFVCSNAKQMNTLVEDVLEFSKFSNKKIELEWVNLNRLMELTIASIQPTLEKKSAHIESENLPTINSNETLLIIILKKLIENGLKYNNNNTPIILVKYFKKDHFHHICVIDNGMGIDPAYHRQIFDMFKRLHNREEAKGSGLGLSICQKIIQQMGGRIDVESTLNEGSTFTIVLPIHPELATNNNSSKTEPTFKVLS